jgi:ABC-2 type transport system ATP-binding protein
MEIQINQLTKEYESGRRAVDRIDLDIKNGMFGLLGPNGAGKTTLMRILATLMKPTSGHVRVNDFDLQKHRGNIRAMLGYLPQDFSLFAKLRTYEFLDYVARLAGMKQPDVRKKAVDEMLEKVGLFDARDRMANHLSGGMKRRLGIAQALIGDPKIVIVDEPTTGLDPEERIRFRNLLAELSRGEIIIILSTHIVGDISSTCMDMALMNLGKIVFNGSPDKLVDKARGHVWQIEVVDRELEQIKEKYPVISTIPNARGYEVQVVADEVIDFPSRPVDPNLEHAYVHFMESLG